MQHSFLAATPKSTENDGGSARLGTRETLGHGKLLVHSFLYSFIHSTTIS